MQSYTKKELEEKDLDYILYCSQIYAGKMAGEYLEELNKYNLAELNELEWETFLNIICREYDLKRAEMLIND